MSVYNTLAPVVLEPASHAFVETTANPPFLAGDSVGGNSGTHATRAAVAQAVSTLRQALHTA